MKLDKYSRVVLDRQGFLEVTYLVGGGQKDRAVVKLSPGQAMRLAALLQKYAYRNAKKRKK